MSKRLKIAALSLLMSFVFTFQTAAQQVAPPSPKFSPATTTIFADKASETDLNFTHFNVMTGKLYLPEIMGSGATYLRFGSG